MTETCPICGEKLKTKTVFKGRSMYRAKRKSLYCPDSMCNYSTIVETEREQMISEGVFD